MNKDSVVVLESSSLLHPPASPYQRFTVSVVAVGTNCRTLHVVTKETTEVTAVEESLQGDHAGFMSESDGTRAEEVAERKHDFFQD